MRVAVLLTILIFALVFPTPLCAETSSPKLAPLIGYVDFAKALNDVSDGKRAKERLKSEFREKQEQLNKMQSELSRMRDAIERDRLISSADAMATREEAYRRKYDEVGNRLENFKREIQAKENELTESILSRLRQVVRDIGEEDGYALILERSQDIVVYAPNINDLTNRVIDAYEKSRGRKK